MPISRTYRILIVDDDPDWREFLRFCLEDLGYEGVEASNGEEALALMAEERFPIILLDMNMPGISGEEVLRRLPQPNPRVVLLTASSAQEVVGTLQNTSCYYLPKDAGSDALSLMLQSLQH